MQRTRQQILDHTKRHGPATVDKLATELGVVPVTIRSHVAILEKEDLLRGEEVRNGKAGRPRIVYSLTEKARELFPKSYDRLATRLLDVIAVERGENEVKRIFEAAGRAWSTQVPAPAEDQSIEEKLEMATSVLKEEGADIELDVQDGHAVISIFNCPYTSVVEEFPHLCTMERTFLSEVLQAPVTIQESGPSVPCCRMTVQLEPARS